MNYNEVLANARGNIGKLCKACPVCNGLACRNTVPGPGAKGVGDTAIRNYQKWQEIRVNMDTLCAPKTVDTSLELFGKKFKYPFFAGPVGAVNLHYSDAYDDVSYNKVLVSACAENGIVAFTGDGTNPKVMEAATDAIALADGMGVPTVKPWNLDTIREKMDLVKKSGAFAVAMDVDAAGLPFLKNMDPPAGGKSVEDLKAIAEMAGAPFIVKGVMTVKGALKAKEAGAAAIVVSNHGGRVGSVSGDSRSIAGNREGCRRQHEDIRGRRHSKRCGYFQGAGTWRRCSYYCSSVCNSSLRRCRRGCESLY